MWFQLMKRRNKKKGRNTRLTCIILMISHQLTNKVSHDINKNKKKLMKSKKEIKHGVNLYSKKFMKIIMSLSSKNFHSQLKGNESQPNRYDHPLELHVQMDTRERSVRSLKRRGDKAPRLIYRSLRLAPRSHVDLYSLPKNKYITKYKTLYEILSSCLERVYVKYHI